MKRLFLGLSLLAILGLSTTFVHADGDSVIGVVTRVDPGIIQIVTDSGDTRLVAVDPDTKYVKWLMAKSFGQDPLVDIAFLRVGDRVRIRMRNDEPVARKVWIVQGPDHPEG